MKNLSSDALAYFAAVRSDFYVFVQQAFHTIYPGKQFLDNWHIEAIVHRLEQTRRGELPRLVLNLPPRQLKSFIVSVAWPAFLLGQDPTAKLICVSYSDELAKALSRDFRRLVESTWYQRVFNNVKLIKVTESETVTDKGGMRYATSVNGSLTGRGGDYIIIDDPIKPDDALSDKARNSVNDWYSSTLLSRLDDKQRSVLILVMQRLHVDDLSAHVLRSGGFTHLCLPAIARIDETIPLRHGRTYRRLAGEALHQDRESLAVLESLRASLGSLMFAAQYQQCPEAPEGNLFKRKWIKFIDHPPLKHAEGCLVVSIDSAASTSEHADYSALTRIYVTPGDFYVLSSERGRWDYEFLKAKCLQYYKQYGDDMLFVVEAASTGVSLINYLESCRIRCMRHTPRHDKFTRACWALPFIEAGHVHLLKRPGQDLWVEPFLSELLSFPHSRYDDQVDSLIQLIPNRERLRVPRSYIIE